MLRSSRGEGQSLHDDRAPDRPAAPAVDDSPTERAQHRSRARLLKRVFEVDPRLCPQCNVEMKFVAVIQDFSVVDRILTHQRRIGGNDPHEGTAQRAPPAKAASVVGT